MVGIVAKMKMSRKALHRILTVLVSSDLQEFRMKMNRLIPMLPVKSMLTSVGFYQKLGFNIEEKSDHWGWAMLCFDECRLMVDQSIARRPPPCGSLLVP